MEKGNGNEFDFTQPFTITEFMAHFEIGSPQDPSRTKEIAAVLRKKGYTRKFYKRSWRWAKWPDKPTFTMPEIP